MPNRNYTTVCIFHPIMLSVHCHSVNIALLFQHHVAIAADTCGFLYDSSPIKVLPHLRTSMHRMWGNSRGFDLLER